MDFSLNKKQNANFKEQLGTFFEQYREICVQDRGTLAFINDRNFFEGEEPTVIRDLNKILSSLSSITGEGILKIYKVGRKTNVTFYPDSSALSRVIMLVGDDAFVRMPIATSGLSTGRAPHITRFMEGGTVTMLNNQSEVRFIGDFKHNVFVKGKGKKEMVKPSNFEQFIIYYELEFDDELMKSMKKKLLRGEGLKDKEKIEDIMEQIQNELNGGTTKEKEEEKVEGEEEFMV